MHKLLVHLNHTEISHLYLAFEANSVRGFLSFAQLELSRRASIANALATSFAVMLPVLHCNEGDALVELLPTERAVISVLELDRLSIKVIWDARSVWVIQKLKGECVL